MTEERCEPPPELRGVDGLYWLKLSQSEEPTIGHWFRDGYWKAWNTGGSISVETAGAFGYRYIAPVATPAEVDALRAERDKLRTANTAYRFMLSNAKDKCTTLRARVDALEAALIPFARYSKKFPEADANAPLTVFVSDIPRMGDCHAARAALEEKP